MDTFRIFIESLEPVWQWLGVLLVSMIPFVESYGGAFLGILAGVIYYIAIPAAIIGNIVSMIITVSAADKIRFFAVKDKELDLTPKQTKFKKTFDKFGIPGVSLLGQTILPSQITSGLMVGFGASRQKVIFWQIISITIWGVLFGLLGQFVNNAFLDQYIMGQS